MDVKKLMMALSGATAAVSAAAALGMAVSSADPASNSIYNVVGEPYAKAVAILRAQGIPTTFGGSVGSDVPQSRCIVSSQKVLGTGKMQRGGAAGSTGTHGGGPDSRRPERRRRRPADRGSPGRGHRHPDPRRLTTHCRPPGR